MNQSVISYIVIVGAIIVSLFIVFPKTKTTSKSENQNFSASKQETKNEQTDVEGKQIIEITARGGYTPNIIQAKADIDTILRVETRNTFDCSSAFTIPELKISKNLPVTGTTDFNIGSHKAGTKLQGSCSMGMYGFEIEFN